MKKYLTYLNGDLKPALMALPDPMTFETMYGDGYRDGDLTGVPVKTIAAWLNIDVITLPPSDRLTEAQQVQMAKTLLSYWSKKDEFVNIIRSLNPKRQYECAVEFLAIEAQYDGLGGFKLVEKEWTAEEWADIHEKHNSLMRNLFSELEDRTGGQTIFDMELPF